MTAARETDVSWPLASVLAGRDGVRHAVLASADGILLGKPVGSLSRDDGERLAAIAATLVGTSRAIQRTLATAGAGSRDPHIVISTGERDYLIVPIADSVIVVLFLDGTADLGSLVYAVQDFGRRIPAEFYFSG